MFFLDLFSHPFLGRFWDPAGTPKSIKNRVFAKTGAPGSSFLTIFWARARFLVFLVDSGPIFAGLTPENYAPATTGARFSQNRRFPKKPEK